MKKKRLYLETTIVGHLAARPSRDLIVVARQEITWEWWERRRHQFDLFVSELVVQEASGGDPDSAQQRLKILRGIPLLNMKESVIELAEALVQEGPFPEKAADDAVHLSVATVFGMDFLLTWNCRHLANAEFTERVGDLLRLRGYQPPVVCTPEVLMGE